LKGIDLAHDADPDHNRDPEQRGHGVIDNVADHDEDRDYEHYKRHPLHKAYRTRFLIQRIDPRPIEMAGK